MGTGLNEELQDVNVEGQLSFFPEMETEKQAAENAVQHSIRLPDAAQLSLLNVRILLADVLMRFDGELPEQWLFDIMVRSGFFDYFTYSDALGALTEHGAAVIHEPDGVRMVTLTEKGRKNARELRLYVPKLFRDQVHLKALRYTARQRALRDLRITYEDVQDGCRVSLACCDNSREMFFLRITAPGRSEAESIGESILRNPARFFGKILDVALTNEEEQFDLSDN